MFVRAGAVGFEAIAKKITAICVVQEILTTAKYLNSTRSFGGNSVAANQNFAVDSLNFGTRSYKSSPKTTHFQKELCHKADDIPAVESQKNQFHHTVPRYETFEFDWIFRTNRLQYQSLYVLDVWSCLCKDICQLIS